jgi:hypothetical protein
MGYDDNSGSWRDPDCITPIEVDPNERNPFCDPPGQGSGACKGGAEPVGGANYSATQDPASGTLVETSAPSQTNQTTVPEPSCGGDCNCTPGPTRTENNEVKSAGKTSVSISVSLANISQLCKCEGQDGKPVTWYQKTEPTTIDVVEDVETKQQTWDEVYDVSCSCGDPACSCSDNYTVTTSYSREFYVVPAFTRLKEVPGAECDANSDDVDKNKCPEPCKPIVHNWGPKCNGCGGTHGGTAPTPTPTPTPTPAPGK